MRIALLVLLNVTCIRAVSAATVAQPASPAPTDTALVLHVEVGSRLYPTWHEQLRLRLGELFYLGDSEFTARIDRFLPDFRIIDGKFLSVTQELANPAARVIVFHDTTATDSTWAFLKFPPHFSPRSFFTFKLLEIQGWVPAAKPELPPAPRDSTATRSQRSEDDAGARKPEEGRHE